MADLRPVLRIRALDASGAEIVAPGNPGCIMQIGAGLITAGLMSLAFMGLGGLVKV